MVVFADESPAIRRVFTGEYAYTKLSQGPTGLIIIIKYWTDCTALFLLPKCDANGANNHANATNIKNPVLSGFIFLFF